MSICAHIPVCYPIPIIGNFKLTDICPKVHREALWGLLETEIYVNQV